MLHGRWLMNLKNEVHCVEIDIEEYHEIVEALGKMGSLGMQIFHNKEKLEWNESIFLWYLVGFVANKICTVWGKISPFTSALAN